MSSQFNTVMHAQKGLRIDITASCAPSEVYIALTDGNGDVRIYLSWDQLDRLLFLGSVAAREHNESLKAPLVDLAESAAQHIDAINE